MDSKTITGYCETQKSNYSVDIKILESRTSEGICKNYGTYNCKFKSLGNLCTQSECSILSANNIRVGDSL